MAAGRIILPVMPALDRNGNPVEGALLYFYENETTTLKAVYADVGLTVPLSNPVVADSAGQFPAVYADNDDLYSVRGFDPDGAQLPRGAWDDVEASVAVAYPGSLVVSPYMQTVLLSTDYKEAIEDLSAQSRIVFDVRLETGYSTADATAAINSAIGKAALLPNGGDILIPENVTILGTVNITAHGIVLRGSTFFTQLTFNNGTADDIYVDGSVIGGAGIYNWAIKDLLITHPPGKAGGTSLRMYKANQGLIERVQVNNAYEVFDARVINNVIMNYCLAINVYGPQAGRFRAAGDGTDRSDVLQLMNTVINVGSVGGGATDGIIWDGYAHTLRINALGILNARDGLVVKNTSASSSFYPTFCYAVDLEIDGTLRTPVDIRGGAQFNFVGCDCFALSTAAGPIFKVSPDTGASLTNVIKVIGGRYYGGQGVIFNINAKNYLLDGVTGAGGSNAGAGVSPVVAIGALSDSGQIIGCQLGSTWGSTQLHSYAIDVAAGAQRLTADRNITYGCQTGDIRDLSATGTVNLGGGIGRTGTPTAAFSGTLSVRANNATFVEMRAQNDGTGATQTARWVAATGTANAFVSGTVVDNSGAPYYIVNGGAAVTTHYTDFDTMVWRNNAAAEKGRLDTAGLKLPTGSAYFINSLQVVGPRQTGWSAMAGTATKGGFDTATVTLPQLAQLVKAIIDERLAAGSIGA